MRPKLLYASLIIFGMGIFPPWNAKANQWAYSGESIPKSTPAQQSQSPATFIAQASTADMNAPRNNMTQAAVRKTFGDPQEEIPAVGIPPISRWRYADYIVYFEHDRVIISVPSDVGVNR